MTAGKKIYTRTGDDGTTGTAAGTRLPKDDPLLEATGALDETNSQLAVLLGYSQWERWPDLLAALNTIQHLLFNAGSDLSLTGTKTGRVLLKDKHLHWLEKQIDLLEEELPPLKAFILPGGSALSAATALLRVTVRRAERALVAAGRQHPVPGLLLRFSNRLSDYCFLLERAVRHREGLPDRPWNPEIMESAAND